MLYSLLPLLLAPSLLWRFPPEAASARDAARQALAEDAEGHLLDDADLSRHLKATPPSGGFGCLADEGVCGDVASAAIAALGIKGEVIVEVTPPTKGGEVKATLRLQQPGQVEKRWQGQGQGAEGAVAAAVAAYRGQGALIFEVTPATARLEIDGASVGEGGGRYPLAPGRHALRVTAEGHRTLETEAQITARQSTHLKVELHRMAGELILSVQPREATVFIDEMPISDPSAPISLPPGEHALRCEAEGYDRLSQRVTIKDHTQTRLRLDMVHAEPPWRRALRGVHADTHAHLYYARVALGYATVDDGALDGGFGQGNQRVEVAAQRDNISLLSGEIALGWRWGELGLIEPLNVQIIGGGDAVDARLSDETLAEVQGDGPRAQIKDLQHTVIRARIGARYPRWRLIPYALLGPSYTRGEFTLSPPEGEAGVIQVREWGLNLEAGARYQHDDALFIGAATSVDWAGRMTSTFSLSLGLALDLPEGL
ncbi:PEGA domain-containing protein [Myxococcota bacterium]|nr:PEGA domain-containing protein [Myxococcota bacterium]